MYIIVMNEDKTLVASKRINLYEGDNLADKLMFLLPQTYKEIELGECIVRLNYTDLNGEEISEILVKDEELYKDRLCYRYPVDSRFTEYYRDIVYDISFSVSEDVDGDGTEDDVLFHTENHMIRILPRPDSIIHEDSIQKDAAGKIQKEMLELEHRIIALEENGLDVKDVVKYTEQDLTEEQKIQARKNIDAISKDDVVVKQSDWNQNDETAPDYIKNRTHYVYKGKVADEVLFDGDIDYSITSGMAYCAFPSPLPLTNGTEYLVQFNDTVITLVCGDTTVLDDNYSSTIGSSVTLASNGITIWYYKFGVNLHLKISTIKIADIVVSIDDKYIPDTVLRYEIEETLEWSDVEMTATDDGNGNVTVETTGMEITDDGNGNVIITSEHLTTVNNNGNITISV